jgi:hypothetical protein
MKLPDEVRGKLMEALRDVMISLRPSIPVRPDVAQTARLKSDEPNAQINDTYGEYLQQIQAVKKINDDLLTERQEMQQVIDELRKKMDDRENNRDRDSERQKRRRSVSPSLDTITGTPSRPLEPLLETQRLPSTSILGNPLQRHGSAPAAHVPVRKRTSRPSPTRQPFTPTGMNTIQQHELDALQGRTPALPSHAPRHVTSFGRSVPHLNNANLHAATNTSIISTTMNHSGSAAASCFNSVDASTPHQHQGVPMLVNHPQLNPHFPIWPPATQTNNNASLNSHLSQWENNSMGYIVGHPLSGQQTHTITPGISSSGIGANNLTSLPRMQTYFRRASTSQTQSY